MALVMACIRVGLTVHTDLWTLVGRYAKRENAPTLFVALSFPALLPGILGYAVMNEEYVYTSVLIIVSLMQASGYNFYNFKLMLHNT